MFVSLSEAGADSLKLRVAKGRESTDAFVRLSAGAVFTSGLFAQTQKASSRTWCCSARQFPRPASSGRSSRASSPEPSSTDTAGALLLREAPVCFGPDVTSLYKSDLASLFEPATDMCSAQNDFTPWMRRVCPLRVNVSVVSPRVDTTHAASCVTQTSRKPSTRPHPIHLRLPT